MTIIVPRVVRGPRTLRLGNLSFAFDLPSAQAATQVYAGGPVTAVQTGRSTSMPVYARPGQVNVVAAETLQRERAAREAAARNAQIALMNEARRQAEARAAAVRGAAVVYGPLPQPGSGIPAGSQTIPYGPGTFNAPVIEASGEVMAETRGPSVPSDPEFEAAFQAAETASDNIDMPGMYVSDLSPSMIPTREAWKTWLPIGVAVLGLAGAVYILRRK